MATRDDVRRFVIDEFSETLALFDDECRLDAELDEVGCDSLDLVEVAMEIESQFDVEFEDDDLAKCKTIGDVVDLTCRQLGV